MTSSRRTPGKRSLYEQEHIWIVEMLMELPMRRAYWSPTVGVGLDRDCGRVRLAQWKARNPHDRFRLSKYRRAA